MIRIWSIFFVAAIVLSVGLQYLISSLRGKVFDFTDGGLTGLITFLLLWSVGVLGIYFFFPRTKYMDCSDSDKPSFKFIRSTEIDVSQEFDFSYLKTEIAKKWLITFSDDTTQTLKFTSKMSFFKWGVEAAAWLQLDNDARKIYLECFSLSGLPDNTRVKKMQKEIEQCVIQSNR